VGVKALVGVIAVESVTAGSDVGVVGGDVGEWVGTIVVVGANSGAVTVTVAIRVGAWEGKRLEQATSNNGKITTKIKPLFIAVSLQLFVRKMLEN
jgi:hypothetical protein